MVCLRLWLLWALEFSWFLFSPSTLVNPFHSLSSVLGVVKHPSNRHLLFHCWLLTQFPCSHATCALQALIIFRVQIHYPPTCMFLLFPRAINLTPERWRRREERMRWTNRSRSADLSGSVRIEHLHFCLCQGSLLIC